MTVTATAGTEFRAAHEQLVAGRGRTAPDWVGELRTRGIRGFEEQGLPTLRDEDWRFTSLARLAETSFSLGADAADVPADAVRPWLFPDLPGPLLVFVDGRYASALSRPGGLPEGVLCTSLAEAVRSHEDVVRPHLDRLAPSRPEPLTSLNAAFLEDGLFLHVPRGVVVEGAVHALFLATEGAGTMAHPRNLILVGETAQVSVVEDYVSLGSGASLTNAVSEVVVEDGGVCAHYVLERENEESLAVTTVHAEQGRDSQFASHSALVGGALVRNNVYPVLRGEGGWCLLNGLYVPTGRQHHDTFMVVHHASPHCDSRQFYRGILNDRARAVFSGRIVVHEGAQKTDAKQTNMNLLLSDDALIDTKPQLEIYADDVKCTHGATVGQLDAEAIFYLRARGVPEREARGLLTFAFVNEVLDRMDLEPVRATLRGELERRLPGVKLSENGA
jgi:Fe-S cluster assembly protein SufD